MHQHIRIHRQVAKIPLNMTTNSTNCLVMLVILARLAVRWTSPDLQQSACGSHGNLVNGCLHRACHLFGTLVDIIGPGRGIVLSERYRGLHKPCIW
jgi:hypothetical protein